MVTSRDVAELAGVSQATVSRAMSAADKLSPATVAKVRAAMDTLGYVPHAGAQAMKNRRTNVVGVVVAELTNPFYSEVLDELTRELGLAGYRVVMWNAGGGSHTDALSAIRQRAVDGVVLTTATEDSAELRAAVERDSPLVLINRVVQGFDCDQVTSDNVAGGRAVADLLVAEGRTQVAYVGGSEKASTSRDRSRGFLERMAQLGHPVADSRRFTADYSHQRSAEVVSSMLFGADPPRAVFCANDYMAFGAIDARRVAGVSTQDLWVIGYDDVEMASWPSFDLTTVRQPSREMAREAVRMLVQRLGTPTSGSAAQHVEFPCRLVVRGSTPAAGTRSP